MMQAQELTEYVYQAQHATERMLPLFHQHIIHAELILTDTGVILMLLMATADFLRIQCVYQIHQEQERFSLLVV